MKPAREEAPLLPPPAASDKPRQLAAAQQLLCLAAALLYGAVGLAMGFANKAVLQQWPYSNTFLALQMAASIALVYAANIAGLVPLRPLEAKSALQLLPVVFFYNANVAFALAAVRALSIPVYHVMKRLTPVMVLTGRFFCMGGPRPSNQIVLSVLTVVTGCIFAGLGDLSFDLRILGSTYELRPANHVPAACGAVRMRKSSSELLAYNAVLSLPVLVILVMITGEVQASLPLLLELTNGSIAFLALFVFTLVMGCLLNYSLFLCTICNSALTTTIVGTLRSVFGTILGFFVLGGVKATVLIVTGVTVNTAGGIWYTVTKYKERHSKF
eukprot:SM000041S15541  [mRNA]  locus=s41:781249:783761:+ [translate_table: standard]